MKKIICLFTILISLNLAKGQDDGDAKKFKVVFGDSYEIPKKYGDWGFIGNPSEGIVQISVGKELMFQRFDPSSLKLTKQTIIDLSSMPKGFVVEFFKMLNDKYYMFYSIWDKSRKREQLFAHEVDLKKGAFAGKAQKLLETSEIAGSDKYKYYRSADDSKFLISYRLKPEVRNDAVNKDIIGFHVFDKELNKIWGKEFKMPYTEEMMDNWDYDLDSKGNAYLLAKVFEGKRKEEVKDEPNYHYELLKFGVEDQKLKKIKIDIQNLFIKELWVVEHATGEMVCAGYYGNEAGGNSSDGVFMVRIDNQGNVQKMYKGVYEFPTEILKLFEKKSTQKKVDKAEKKKNKDAEAANLELRKVILNEDGSVVICGEQYTLITRVHYSQGKTYYTYIYVYGDIFVTKIAGNGELAWVRKIPKFQSGGAGRGGMSFKHFGYGDDNYFFYLDNARNINLGPDEAPAKHMDGAGGILTVSKIDGNGNVSKGKLFDLREKDVVVYPHDFDTISGTTIYGRAQTSRKMNKMMKIDYNP